MKLFPGRLLYLIVGGIASLDTIWLTASSRLYFDYSPLIKPSCILAAVIVCLALLERIQNCAPWVREMVHRCCNLIQGVIFAQVCWVALTVLNYATMSTAFPYADEMLSRWDAFLGFDWTSYFEAVRTSRMVGLLEVSYVAIGTASMLTFGLLMASSDPRRARYFLETTLVSGFVCTVIGMFLPARGSVATYLGETADFAGFSNPPGLYFVDALSQLRGDAMVVLNPDQMPGLVSFPSFHTAAGVIIVVSFWRTRLFWPAFAFSALMIAATPVLGGHYLVDLLSGAAVALAVLAGFAALPFYRGMLGRTAAWAFWKSWPGGRQAPAPAVATLDAKP